ncbi:MAG TPA: glycosyltransferase family 4 protein [Candidatus Eisenbacteria bacterium]
MRIAIVKPIIPWPAVQGTRRVTMGLIDALAGEHEVTLVAPSLDAADEVAADTLARERNIRVVTVRAPNRRSLFHRGWYRAAYAVAARLGGHSPRALYATPPALFDRLARESAGHPFDLAIFEYWYTYRAFHRVPSRHRVLLAHDADFAIAGRKDGASFASAESRREAEACRNVEEVWTLTTADREALAAHAGLPRDRFRIMPFGVDTTALDLEAGSNDGTVLFFGAWQADFNVDALGWLLDEIWPAVKRRLPTTRLEVAGGGMPEALAERVRKAGGTVSGRVEDLAALYRRAAVVLIPLRFGGGLRIRLIEALAARRAVVSTAIGIGGLEGRDGRDWLLASDAEGLAEATACVLRDPALGRRLGEAGRELVATRYSDASAAEGLRRLVTRFDDRRATG